jgi:hypothetical protein
MRRLGLAGECQAHNKWKSPALGANQFRLLMPHLSIVGYIINSTGFTRLELYFCFADVDCHYSGMGLAIRVTR